MRLSKKKADQDAREEVLAVDQLPPLNFAAARLVEVASDPDLDIPELAAIIEQDPPLTARLLSLANSAYFGQREPILGVQRAIVQVLGLNRVRSLSLAMALAGSFDTRRCPAFDTGDYWLYSLLTATVAAAIGQRIDDEDACPVDSLYLCGLLNNIGLLVLVHVRPSEMSGLLAKAAKDDKKNLIELEQQALGIDHRWAGEWLAFRWQLPEIVVHTLADLADSDYWGEHAAVVEIVRVASQWAQDRIDGIESTLSVPGLSEADASAVEQETLGRFDNLRALAGAFTQQAPVRV